ncbi:MAG: hypothetical protein ACJ71I_01360 [Nitrososphaeraceae archaeon]
MSLIHHLTSNVISFLALHETVRSDPKMTKIIPKILITNDREQYKDNNTNDNAINIFKPIIIPYSTWPKSITKTFFKHLQIMLEMLVLLPLSYL